MAYVTRLLLLPVLLLLSGCSTFTHFSHKNASGYRTWDREECVPYARRVSGINIRGDAYTWWDKAAGKYQRGSRPVPGAVLALSRSSKLRSGHLSVVKEVLAPRDINVAHANWGNDWSSRRVVYDSQRAQDVSPNNDWTAVRFWNDEHGVFGAPYPANGFIYNMPAQTPMMTPMPMAAPVVMPPVQAPINFSRPQPIL